MLKEKDQTLFQVNEQHKNQVAKLVKAVDQSQQDKEELTLKCSSLEDKLQKMELDREQQRLKVKQQGQIHAEMEDKIDKLNGEKEALQAQIKEAVEQHELALKSLHSDTESKVSSLDNNI